MAEDRKTVHVPVVVDNNAMPVATAPLRAVAAGQIKIGNIVIDCYVLSDEKRVVTRRTLLGAITSKGAEIKGAAGMGDLGRYLKRLPSRFAHLSSRPGIEFVTTSGARAIGHTVAEFGDICDAYVSGALAGELKSSQMPIAVQCHTLNQAAKAVGWTALVDEATGYQGVRASMALQRLFDRIVRKEAARWEMLWTPEIVGAICRVFGVPYDGKGCPKWMAGVIHTIYDMVLGSEVHEEIRRLNPDRPDRKKHHQHLQEEAREITREDLLMVKALADQSGSKSEFWQRLGRHYRGTAIQLLLTGPVDSTRPPKVKKPTPTEA